MLEWNPENFKENDVIWVVDTSLLKDTLSEDLPNIISRCGYRLITLYGSTDYFDSNSLCARLDELSGPVIAYGTHNFIKGVHNLPWYPGSYPQTGDELESLDNYFCYYPTNYFLNNDGIFYPISVAIKNKQFLFDLFHTNQLFVKDNKSFKRFNAKLLKFDEFDEYLKLHQETNHINPFDMIFISSSKAIYSEHRFVIIDNEVVTHSTYMLNGIIDIRIDVPKQALDFANQVIKVWSPCSCYTLDICLIGNDLETAKPKILELNSFSCAGLYACDLEKVVKSVSKQTRLDYIKVTKYF